MKLNIKNSVFAKFMAVYAVIPLALIVFVNPSLAAVDNNDATHTEGHATAEGAYNPNCPHGICPGNPPAANPSLNDFTRAEVASPFATSGPNGKSPEVIQ